MSNLSFGLTKLVAMETAAEQNAAVASGETEKPEVKLDLLFGEEWKFSALLTAVPANVGDSALHDPLGGVAEPLCQVANRLDRDRL
jgi:hypothetical protein